MMNALTASIMKQELMIIVGTNAVGGIVTCGTRTNCMLGGRNALTISGRSTYFRSFFVTDAKF